MSNLYPVIAEMNVLLSSLDSWLEAGVAHAKSKSFDPEVLVGSRLAVDQYPLSRQVQAACDAAKYAAARPAGKEAPSHPDEEKTLAELRTRIGTARAYLDSFTEKDFEGAETRKVALPFLPGGNKGTFGLDYVVRFAQPNFYFHLVHAYAILRHNGVPLGKIAYIGGMPPTFDL